MKIVLIILGVLCVVFAFIAWCCIKVGADSEYGRKKDKEGA